MFSLGRYQQARRLAVTSLVLPALILFLSHAGAASAQSLNWEGQTGVFITPLAYTAPSGKSGFGKPVVAYHYLNGGEVLGGVHTASVTAGLAGRAEFGYTRAFHQPGDTPGLSTLWKGGFNVVHGKVNLVAENARKHRWIPALSAGFVARTQVGHVSGVLAGSRSYSNGDVYLVASKTVTQVKGLPLVFNLGYKATNAQVFGLAGNAPGYKGRLFGAAAFVVTGPGKSQVILGSEVAQQPRDVRNLPGAVVPTTITYAARIVPHPEKARFNIDFGVAQAAGKILPGVDLKARHQFALGISYGL